MRYELTDHEWAAIKPMLSNTSHAVSHEPPCPQSMGRSRGGLTTDLISGTVAFLGFLTETAAINCRVPLTGLSAGSMISKSSRIRMVGGKRCSTFWR